MIARLNPAAYDCEGKPVSRPQRKQAFRPTFPMPTYMTQPLQVRCSSLDQIPRFLAQCQYVSDNRQHGVRDYWTPPEEFEQARRGDCDCFAVWSWRQLVEMGWEARYVLGTLRGPDTCHAWVTFRREDGWYLLEPTAARIGMALPGLGTLAYTPHLSAQWDGQRIHYFEHAAPAYRPPFREMLRLLLGSAAFWGKIRLRRSGRRLVVLALRGVGRRPPSIWLGPGPPLKDEPRLTARRAIQRWWRHLGGR